MAKRFTDTNIWKNQKWFRRLTPINKLFWRYLTDACDHAGVWKIDYLTITEDLGIEDFSISAFIEACNQDFDKLTGKPLVKERVILVADSHLWLTGFIQFQYENKQKTVNQKVAVIRSALEILEGLSILQQGLDKGYIRLTEPLDKGYQTLKDKDRDKDVLEEEGAGEETTTTEGVGLCHQMLKVFKDVHPAYQHDDNDMRELLSIGHKIASMKRYTKNSITAENQDATVGEWLFILSKIRGDPFYGTKDIAFLNKDWKSLTLKIYNQQSRPNGRIRNSDIT